MPDQYYRVRACHNTYCGGWSNTIVVTDPTGGGGCPPYRPNCGPGGPGGPQAAPTASGNPPATPSTWRLVVHYSYGSLGYLTSMYGTDAISPYWALTGMDAAGHVIAASGAGGANTLTHIYDRATARLIWVEAKHGSSLVFDEQYAYDIWGERIQRKDVLSGQIEDYSYSVAARLTQVKLATGSLAVTLSANYDGAGNLTSKSDRGGTVSYTYGQSAHPNRLTSLGVAGSNPGVAGGSLSYDAAGRVLSGAGYSIGYNRRGLTATIAAHGHSASLAYAPDGHRYRMTVDGESTHYLMGGAFRVVQTAGGVTAYRQAIFAGGTLVAQQVTRSDAGSDFQYFYHDGLGSPVAFADFSGANAPPGVAYGPYGRTRNAGNWATLDTGTPLATHATRRGYTGGEQLAEMGIVGLGMRVYVPALGRWLSPDPAGVESPYVYAHDNPIGAVDPTGALSLDDVTPVLKTAAIIAAAWYTGVAVEAGGGSPMLAGAFGGMEAGYIRSGGDIEAAAFGGMQGAAMGFIGGAYGNDLTTAQYFEKGALEGVVAGGFAKAQGGRFTDGFLGAFVSAVSSPLTDQIAPGNESYGAIVARTAVAAVLGGTAAEIGGGSFANGAWSAAFQHLFNDAMDRMFQGMVRDMSGRAPSRLSQLSDEERAYKNNPAWQASGPNPETACNDIACYAVDQYLRFWMTDVPLNSIPAGRAEWALTLLGRGSIKTIEYSTEHSRDFGRACFFCGALFTPTQSLGPEMRSLEPSVEILRQMQRDELYQSEYVIRHFGDKP